MLLREHDMYSNQLFNRNENDEGDDVKPFATHVPTERHVVKHMNESNPMLTTGSSLN